MLVMNISVPSETTYIFGARENNVSSRDLDLI